LIKRIVTPGDAVQGRSPVPPLATTQPGASAMKRIKQEPSIAGLLLIVTGMLLLSILMLQWTGSSPAAGSSMPLTISLGSAAAVSLAVGAALSSRRRKRK
jgi:hypothetical protein